MKKIIYIIVLLACSGIAFGQSNFDALEDINGITSVIVTKDMFELLSKFPDAKSKNMDVFSIAKGVDELKIYTSQSSQMTASMEKMVVKVVKENSLTELMRVNDKQNNTKIYIKAAKNKNFVSQVLMFVKGKDHNDKTSETVIVNLNGNIDVDKLSKIAVKYVGNN
ncbi:MAG: DUF4252 domain-containing protein [Tenacibaculum sp.]